CRRTICLSARSARSTLGISLRMDTFPRHSNRDNCGSSRCIRQVSRCVLSCDFIHALDRRPHWAVPTWDIGPVRLGGMQVGLNTQNLVAILMVMAISVINIFGVKTGALIQNIFTAAKVSALLGLV